MADLSTGSGWLWKDAGDPGTNEADISEGNWWLNTTSGNIFVCCDATPSSQVWNQMTVVP